jgi:hypothetical protein
VFLLAFVYLGPGQSRRWRKEGKASTAARKGVYSETSHCQGKLACEAHPKADLASSETTLSFSEKSGLHSILGACEAQGTNGVAILVSTAVLASGITGWKSVGGQLLASGLALLSGHQDIGLRARTGAAFGFFMAIAFGICALVTAVLGNLRFGVAICAVVLCSETLLILRWLLRGRTSS